MSVTLHMHGNLRRFMPEGRDRMAIEVEPATIGPAVTPQQEVPMVQIRSIAIESSGHFAHGLSEMARERPDAPPHSRRHIRTREDSPQIEGMSARGEFEPSFGRKIGSLPSVSSKRAWIPGRLTLCSRPAGGT